MEFAPNQRIPAVQSVRDRYEGTLDQDKDYLDFCQQLKSRGEDMHQLLHAQIGSVQSTTVEDGASVPSALVEYLKSRPRGDSRGKDAGKKQPKEKRQKKEDNKEDKKKGKKKEGKGKKAARPGPGVASTQEETRSKLTSPETNVTASSSGVGPKIQLLKRPSIDKTTVDPVDNRPEKPKSVNTSQNSLNSQAPPASGSSTPKSSASNLNKGSAENMGRGGKRNDRGSGRGGRGGGGGGGRGGGGGGGGRGGRGGGGGGERGRGGGRGGRGRGNPKESPKSTS